MMVQDKKTGEWYDPEQKFKELLEQPWFQEQMRRMAGWKDVREQEPTELQQVLVTDGEEFRVLHREEGSWAFTVSPCDRAKMVYWKELK